MDSHQEVEAIWKAWTTRLNIYEEWPDSIHATALSQLNACSLGFVITTARRDEYKYGETPVDHFDPIGTQILMNTVAARILPH